MINVPNDGVVPTKNRVREAMFSSINPSLPSSTVLDLFAGSGAFGIEALSRGAALAYFVDLSPTTCKIINDNLYLLKETNGKVLNLEAKRGLEYFSSSNISFDIVFIDPPYAKKELYPECVDYLLDHHLLKPTSIVILEFEGDDPYVGSRFMTSKRYNYGKSHVLIMRNPL